MPGLEYPQLDTQDGQVPNLPDLVKELSGKLKQFDITQHDDKALVSSPIAVAFGNLSESPENLDDNTLRAVGGVLIYLKKLSVKKFADLVASFMNNVMVHHVTENEDIRSRSLKKVGGSSSMTKDGKPTAELLKEVNDWLKELIVDDYVINELRSETAALAEVLAMATSKINRQDIKYDGNHVYHHRKLLDIGVLRMPDLDHTDILLYSLKITIEVDCFCSSDRSYEENATLRGEYHWRKFEPRVSLIEALNEEAKERALTLGKQFYS